jgi:hypothetical protein
MKLKLSEMASVAEIIAAIGVILSLIFVGLQINEGNLETRAATIQASADAEAFMIATMLNQSDTWHKVVTGAPFDNEEETRSAILLFNLLMTESENRFHQFNSGFLESQSWDGRVASLHPLVRLPIFEVWKESIGALNHSADFLDFLDSLAEETTID